MVIIIGGSSHVGKTALAQALMEEYKYSYLSLDHLKMGLIRSGMTDLTVNDDYEMRYFLWPIAAEMIKTAIENDQNLIVEGCYIPKEWKDSFSEDYLSKIAAVFIVMSEEYIRNNSSKITEYANVIEHRMDDIIDIDRLVECSLNFKTDCRENGTDYIEITDRYNIKDMVSKVKALVDLKRR